MLSLKVGLPDHGEGVTASSGKVVSVLGEGTGISASVVSIEGVVEGSFVDFPNFDFGVKGGGDQIVIFGVKIYFGDGFSMSIIILN